MYVSRAPKQSDHILNSSPVQPFFFFFLVTLLCCLEIQTVFYDINSKRNESYSALGNEMTREVVEVTTVRDILTCGHMHGMLREDSHIGGREEVDSFSNLKCTGAMMYETWSCSEWIWILRTCARKKDILKMSPENSAPNWVALHEDTWCGSTDKADGQFWSVIWDAPKVVFFSGL